MKTPQLRTKADEVSFDFNPTRHNPGQRQKINLNFYFHPSLWCLKRYKAYKALIKPFESSQRSVKMKI